MIYRNLLSYINYFFSFFSFFSSKLKKVYLNSSIYNNKISKVYNNDFEYRPSSNLLDCLIKYDKKKKKIEDYALDSVWAVQNIKAKDYTKLQSFFWLFSIDLKSSKNKTQSIISNWIDVNCKYNSKSWEFDITSKRIISWLSNSKLTYEESSDNYKKKFNQMIQKQANHLINEIDKSEWVEDKMIGCTAIILVGLSYHDKTHYLNFGTNLLKKIIKFSFDNTSFPKSRNIRQLNFYLKYFVLIRELLKESQNEIPEYIDEIIYYLGQAYALIWQNIKYDILFNGNHQSNNLDFDNYLSRLGYKFKNDNTEVGGYAILKNKKISLIMDVGPSPDKKFSSNYQSGVLSFEIISSGRKLITNSGYFKNFNHQLNKLSKSTAVHSTLVIENNSTCKFSKVSNSNSLIHDGLKIIKKNIIFEKDYWKINASHDGYLKKYNTIHERQIEFYPGQIKFVGHDKIKSKNYDKSLNFEMRFHLEPNVKTMKTQDNKSILIELDNEGWKFTCDDFDISIDNGLFFGGKNSYTENQNILISGMTQGQNQTIKWKLTKL